jgi:hypothetical protein
MPSENHAQALQVLSYVDLTSLNNDDDKATIESLCAKVTIGSQSVAATCVFPEWVATAQAYFEKHDLSIPIAVQILKELRLKPNELLRQGHTKLMLSCHIERC